MILGEKRHCLGLDVSQFLVVPLPLCNAVLSTLSHTSEMLFSDESMGSWMEEIHLSSPLVTEEVCYNMDGKENIK